MEATTTLIAFIEEHPFQFWMTIFIMFTGACALTRALLGTGRIANEIRELRRVLEESKK